MQQFSMKCTMEVHTSVCAWKGVMWTILFYEKHGHAQPKAKWPQGKNVAYRWAKTTIDQPRFDRQRHKKFHPKISRCQIFPGSFFMNPCLHPPGQSQEKNKIIISVQKEQFLSSEFSLPGFEFHRVQRLVEQRTHKAQHREHTTNNRADLNDICISQCMDW